MKSMKNNSVVEVLLVTLAIISVMVMSSITGVSASQFRAEISEEVLPISNIIAQLQERSISRSVGHNNEVGKSLSCAGKYESCSDQQCCVGYICAPASPFVPLPVCNPCGIATEDCYIGRACCPGFSCKLSFGALVGTCYQD
ncbi:hypothetical protein BVRB_6g132490 [Beta vulgaris subsp. vulgaris]|nr:hypothetical protein BVRB_6g132490 [Beta vulgaris subsp. vulgaris]